VKLLRYLVPLAFVAALLAGCGGGGGAAKPAASDVAVVGGDHVTLAQYAFALAEQKASLAAVGQKLPEAGSTQYAQMKTDIIDVLVQQAEIGLEAQKLGLAVTPAEVAKQLAKLKKTNFGGSEKAYRASLKKQGFTDAQVRDYLHEQLLERKVYNQVTKGAKVSKADIATYYAANISQFQKAATRAVEEILVGKNKQALANEIYSQLAGGASFAALAKKYSQDPGSKNKGGKFTATQGSDVPEFDAAVFAPGAKTGVLLKPVKTAQYGWFVIRPVAAVKAAKTTPESKAAPTIRKQLQSSKQQQTASNWMTNVAKTYCTGGKIVYQAGYTPSPDPCTTIESSNPTTT
jgi:parvulin-like peptidyl-prolyl isomerase